jgi:hypothetical protein
LIKEKATKVSKYAKKRTYVINSKDSKNGGIVNNIHRQRKSPEDVKLK